MSERQNAAFPNRVFYIDNLRVFLIMLVICHHLAIGFGAPGGWYYVVPTSPSYATFAVLSLFVIINQSFFMSLFFFVSAYFTPGSLKKKGVKKFLYDRLLRLGIPLAAYYFILNPSVAYISFRFRGERDCGYLQFMLGEAHQYFGWGPLWFVFALLIFTGVYVMVTVVNQRYLHKHCSLSYPSNRQILAFVVAIGFVTFLVRLVFPLGVSLFGLQMAFFPLYISFFLFGIQAGQADWLSQINSHQTKRWFVLAFAFIIALPLIFELGGVSKGLGDTFRSGFTFQSLVYVLWEPVVCIGISMKLLSVFRNRLNNNTTLTGLMSKSAYTVYILHPFFVVIATYMARNCPVPYLVSLFLLIPPVIMVCFIAAHFIRQAPLLDRIL